MMHRFTYKLRWAVLGASAAALILVTTNALAGSGVGGVFNLGVVNTVDAQTTLSGNPGANPELKVINNGTAAAVRGEAQNGIGTNGISVSGVGQQGVSQSGIGALGTHSNTTGASPGVQGVTQSADPAGAGVLGRNNGGGPGLRAVVNAGAPPLAVNSNAKVVSLNADLLDGLDSDGFWKLAGNAGTTPGTDFLGTTDNQALELKVNGQRALRIAPDAASPNLIGGYTGNSVDPRIHGAVIGGGGAYTFENKVTGVFGTVGGGLSNTASGGSSTVGGGYTNSASGDHSTVGGGIENRASGEDSVVPGGSFNAASGDASFAAGTLAKALHPGSFVWGDDMLAYLVSPAANTFTVRARGGIWLGKTSNPVITAGHFIDTSTGAYLSSAGAWTNNSDRAKKHNLRPLSTKDVLEKVARMPITSWSYKAEKPSVRHIGPMAQDFYKAFGLGLDDKHIGTVDEGGVALAAIQGLYRQNIALERENRTLRARLDAQGKRLTRLEDAVLAMSR